jgi:hypothetical protein
MHGAYEIYTFYLHFIVTRADSESLALPQQYENIRPHWPQP